MHARPLSLVGITGLAALLALACSDGPLRPPPQGVTLDAVGSGVPPVAIDRTAAGEALFARMCSACHTNGEGPRIGPDLHGVLARRGRPWIDRWLKDPAAMVQSDPIAKDLFERFKKVQMPAPNRRADDGENLLAFTERPARVAATATDEPSTGGSGAGDLGAPVGEPVDAQLTDAPNVPPPTGRKDPATVVVKLEVKETTLPMADGVDYTFWTFGGHVPGKFIRVRQGDTVEFHLGNHPDNKMPHNIDLHAVTGPGGGAAMSATAPGHASVFTFKALNQGLFVYHCATAPVGMHIANGMYGLIFVEPPGGLPPVDREYYVMQGDFYTAGAYHDKGLQAFDMEKAIDEKPTYVVFNGAEGSLTGDHALKARVGETVRLFVGNGGPNLVSSFHVIGEIFDQVHTEGGTRVQENVQTTLVPAGGSAIVEFKLEVPGTYVMVDHSIFRAFNKGAIGMIKVEGDANAAIYSGKVRDEEYKAGGMTAPDPAITAAIEAEAAGKLTLDMQMAAGKAVFKATCITCHQPSAMGLPNLFPPLAKSDFLMADKTRAIGIVLNGLTGPVTVNGATFSQTMAPLGQLSDTEIASALTFVMSSFGNPGGRVLPAEVKAVRASAPAPKKPGE